MDTLDGRQCALAIKFSAGNYSKNLSHTAGLIQSFCSTVYNLFLKGMTSRDFSCLSASLEEAQGVTTLQDNYC